MAENEGTENKLDHDSESELELEDPLDSLDELELNRFFRSDEATKCSKARKVEGLSVSKSISISSGLESRKAGSRC